MEIENEENAQQEQTTESIDWEEKYKQLQRSTQKTIETLQREKDDIKSKWESTLGIADTHKQQYAQKEQEYQTLVEQLNAIKAEKDTLASSAQKDKKTLERARLIMKKYPQLADLEVDGVLPDADTIEELEPKLQSLAEKITASAKKIAEKSFEGSLPDLETLQSSKQKDQSENDDYIWEQMMKAQKSKNIEEFSKWNDKWIALKTKQNSE